MGRRPSPHKTPANRLTRYLGTGFSLRTVRSSEVAHRAGVNPQTLRYYERRGLLKEPPRQPSGYRSYGEDSVGLVQFVKRAQELGFTLTEVEALLQLASGGPASCDRARTLASEKIAELESKIASLRAMRKALERLVDTCDQPQGSRECPLISTLQHSAGAVK